MTSSFPAAPKDFARQSGRGTGRPSGSDQQARILLRFAGQLDETVLEEALQALAGQDPVLGCGFVETGVLEGRWEPRADLASLRLHDLVEAADAEAAVEGFLADMEVSEAGPPYRARLVRSGGRDVLCFRIDHRLADGAGARAMVYLVAELYRTLRAGRPLPPPCPTFRARTVAGLSGRPSPPRPPAEPRPPFRFPFAVPRLGYRNEHPAYALRDLAPEALARLRASGRRCGATVTDLLLTALVRALLPYARDPADPFVVAVSSDLRAVLPPQGREPICNLYGTLFPELRCVPGEPFPAALQRATAAMSAQRATLTLDAALSAELAYEDLLRGFAREYGWPLTAVRDWTFVILSNVGVIDDHRLDFGGPQVTDARGLGTIALGNELLLCASTFRGRLTLSYGYCRTDVKEAVAEGLMDRLVRELGEFGGAELR